MEVAVIEHNGARSVSFGEGEVVVEDKFEGGVADEVAFHLNAAVDGGVDDVAGGVEEDVDLLEDVDEDLVVVVLADGHVGGRGVDGVGAEDGEVAQLLHVQQAVLALHHLRRDQRLDVRGVGELRVSEVQDLVQDLVDEDEVLADGFLVDEAAEVLDDDDDAVEEFEDVGGGDVEAGGGDDVDGGLLEVGEVNALDIEDGLHVALRQLHLPVEQFRRVLDQVRPEVSVYYRVPARRQEEDLRYHA